MILKIRLPGGQNVCIKQQERKFVVDHTSLYISSPFLRGYDVKMLSFAFYGGHKQAATKIYFSIFYFSF